MQTHCYSKSLLYSSSIHVNIYVDTFSPYDLLFISVCQLLPYTSVRFLSRFISVCFSIICDQYVCLLCFDFTNNYNNKLQKKVLTLHYTFWYSDIIILNLILWLVVIIKYSLISSIKLFNRPLLQNKQKQRTSIKHHFVV